MELMLWNLLRIVQQNKLVLLEAGSALIAHNDERVS